MYVEEVYEGNTALPGVKKLNERGVSSLLTPVYIFSTGIKRIVNVEAVGPKCKLDMWFSHI